MEIPSSIQATPLCRPHLLSLFADLINFIYQNTVILQALFLLITTRLTLGRYSVHSLTLVTISNATNVRVEKICVEW